MKPIKDAMAKATSDIGDVELATPSDWRELAWAFGLRLRSNQSQPFEALFHGSGVQSVLAYQILHTLDTTFAGSFGWRKGAVWAVEEPESFLHSRLQGELARLFGEYTLGQPLQIILSTHSAAFLGAGAEGVTARLDESGRSEFAVEPRRDLIRVAYSSGVTPYAHPLHTGPPKPLLLVEGKNDKDLLVRAFGTSEWVNPYEILCLKDFDPSLSGGDEIPIWLRYQREAVEARPQTSPLIVLLDWEASPQLIAKINKVLSSHPTSRCVKWPEDLTNADLSSNWAGIEKFVSTPFIEHLREHAQLKLLAPVPPDSPGWRYSIEKKRLVGAKDLIHRELRERSEPSDIRSLVDALPWLVQQVKDSPPLL